MDNNSNHLNSDNLIVFFYKWRKPLIALTVLGAVISIIVSLLIEDKYKSTVVLFPTTTSSISKALLSKNNSGKEDILRLGEEEEAEQMLQILNSDEIRSRIIEKYDLMNHYGIDDGVKYKSTALQKEYNGNVTFERTKFMSVEINVLDHNPDTAALIANDIASFLDTVKNKMRSVVANQALEIVEGEYKRQKEYISVLEDSLAILGELGVVDYESQVERITEQLSIAILQGKKNAVVELQKKLDVLGKYGGNYLSISYQLEYETDQLTTIRTKYKEAKVDAESNLQHKFIVNNAFPAEKKSYPIRWLIVAISTVGTFLLTLILILFVESIKAARARVS